MAEEKSEYTTTVDVGVLTGEAAGEPPVTPETMAARQRWHVDNALGKLDQPGRLARNLTEARAAGSIEGHRPEIGRILVGDAKTAKAVKEALAGTDHEGVAVATEKGVPTGVARFELRLPEGVDPEDGEVVETKPAPGVIG